MARINILSPLLADMIAAGEVVERPASAVKELLENSVDAGAKNITVEIRSGGAEYIRVTDDGCGMAPEDAGVCFLRHATSKLRDEKGLEAIGTLGFRGEALAAIGSVSHVELTTRERGKPSGVRLSLSGGDIEEMGECGCPEGTTIIVRGLFYNTPARLKFMKSDKAEGSACCSAALRVALGRPDVSIRCIKDGKEEFFTPGDGRAESAVYSLLGREAAASMLAVSTDDGTFAASGFVSAPSAGRGSRAMQYFFCNGRHIRSLLMQAAVEQAYKNTLLTGRFPACVIYLTIAPGSVDVNVHPAKTEVKFSDERKVFDAVYYAALGALEEKRKPEESPAPAVHPVKLAEPSPAPVRESVFHSPEAHYQTRMDITPAPRQASPTPSLPCQREGSRKAVEGFRPPSHVPPSSAYPPAKSVISAEKESVPRPAELSAQAGSEAVSEIFDVIGEALNLYILVQKGDALIVIDKHAAHERIIFDRLIKTAGAVMSQTLLEPVPVSGGAECAELISKNGELLLDMGFELEPYGEEAFILRAAPADIDPADALPALESVLDCLRKSLRPDPRAAREEALKTVACKAAIKAGMHSEPQEIEKLARAVCSGEVRYCPHGRPVAWTLTREDLDKQFKRIV